ncbi:MAG TPA: DoxX family protein [Bryobacteraceae bacterium]|nr:DoxX family protein [Bryobacteraceae bacterium]
MDDSIAHPSFEGRAFEAPAWKSILATGSAILLGILFIVSGGWKLTDPIGWAARLTQMRFPAELAQAATLAVGIAEAFAGLLLLVPRFRRWGAWLTAALLVAFMIYIGANYNALRGAECSCFPWVKRAVGPGFFIGDLVMLALAILAGVWSRASEGLRTAAIMLGAIAVFSGVIYGVSVAKQTGVKAPDQITVNGQPHNLQVGKQFLYFFDPECSHCFEAAQKLSKMNWNDTQVIAIPTVNPQFAEGFLKDTGLKAGVSTDLAKLKEVFPFVAGPFGVALENGRAKAQYIQFTENEPYQSLKQIGFAQ